MLSPLNTGWLFFLVFFIQFWVLGCYQIFKISASHDSPITKTFGKKHLELWGTASLLCLFGMPKSVNSQSPVLLSLPQPTYIRKKICFRADKQAYHHDLLSSYKNHLDVFHIYLQKLPQYVDRLITGNLRPPTYSVGGCSLISNISFC